jgi:integrase
LFLFLSASDHLIWPYHFTNRSVVMQGRFDSIRGIARAHLLAAQAARWETEISVEARVALVAAVRTGLPDEVLLLMRWEEFVGRGYHIWTRQVSLPHPLLPGEAYSIFDEIVEAHQVPLPRQVRVMLADLRKARGNPLAGPIFGKLDRAKISAARGLLLAEAGIEPVDYRYMLRHIAIEEMKEDTFLVDSYLGKSDEGKISVLRDRRAFIERVGQWFDALVEGAGEPLALTQRRA